MNRFKIRCDERNPVHVKFSVFDDAGANCGQITIRSEDENVFVSRIWGGMVDWNGKIKP